MDNGERFAAAQARWYKERQVAAIRPRLGEDGQPLAVAYTPLDLAQTDPLDDIGLPGEYPFTRGVYAGMYRDRPWQMRIYSGFGTAEETNRRWKFLLEHGNMGVSCAFDLPSQCGLDSDDPAVRDEVGRVGVAVDTLDDFAIMLRDIPLDQVAISLNTHSSAPMMLAMLVAYAEQQGLDPSIVTGSMTTDALKDYVARGVWIFPPGAALRLVADVVEYATQHLPKFYPLVIRGPDIRDAGASIPQEVGYAFANGIAYVDYLTKVRGLDVDSFAGRLSTQFYYHGAFLQEAAKSRAARRIWARLMQERWGAQKAASLGLRITASVGGAYFQALEPEANLVRGTLGCLGAVLGGCQGMLLAGYDEAYDIPTEYTQRLALRTQQIVGYESDATAVADPLGGSYYVEAMTDRLEQDILRHIAEIEDLGGAVAAIESGYMQRQVANSAYETERREHSGEKIIVGVNKFRQQDEPPELTVHFADPAIADKQIARLQQIKAARNNAAVRARLADLRRAAEGDTNLMPLLVAAAREYATLGEMVGALKPVFGDFVEPVVV